MAERENTMFKAAIFDLDGTLMNTIETIAFYANSTLEEYGFKAIETKKYNYMVGNGALQLVERMLKENGCEDVEIIQKVLKSYNEAYDKDTLYKTYIYDGIKELLQTMKKKGLKTAVLSNKPHNATLDVISKMFGENVFDFVYGARDGVPLKPDPTAAKMIAEEMGLKKEECLYIGDTCVDMKTGKSAGFFTVGVLWGYRDRKELEENGADKIVAAPDEIESLL